MRGKVTTTLQKSTTAGITPAYAGKRLFFKPRFHIRIGSPPPMRGKVPLVTSIAIVMGITPAYAGKSWRSMAEK